MRPRSVAIIGASERPSRATRLLRNLVAAGFDGQVFPINPKYAEVQGLRCYPSIASTPEPPDCMVVAIPAEGAVTVLEEGFDAGVRGAVVLSGGFGEAGEEGRQRQAAIERLTAQGMGICGPNCYGLINLAARTVTFSGDLAEPLLLGDVGLISQSGGISSLIANPLMSSRGVGFSFIISCGNQVGPTVEDYVEYLLEDSQTRVIAAYVEGFRQPEKLAGIGRRAGELGKSIVIYKGGRSERARESAIAHTGSLAGDPAEMAALLDGSGILQARDLSELIQTTALLSQSRGKTAGRRIGVLSGSGGECIQVADAIADAGLELPELSPQSVAALRDILPGFGVAKNPVDGTGSMYDDKTIFPRLLDVLLKEPNIDVLALNINPNRPWVAGRNSHAPFAEILSRVVPGNQRLVVAYSSTSGGALDPDVMRHLQAAGVPYLEGTFPSMRALQHLAASRERRARA